MTINKLENTLKSQLNTFEAILENTFQKTWSNQDDFGHLVDLVEVFERIFQQIEKIGNHSNSVLQDSQNNFSELFPSFLIQMEWMEKIKSFFILWRDISFEYHKALLLQKEGKVEAAALNQLRLDAHQIIQSAGESIQNDLVNEVQDLAKDPALLKKKINIWKHLQDPWSSYQKQFFVIKNQIFKIKEQLAIFQEISDDYQEIKKLINQNLDNCKSEIEKYKIIAHESIHIVESTVAEKPGKLAIQLEEKEKQLESSSQLTRLNQSLEDIVRKMPVVEKSSVGVEQGNMIYRDVNFKKSVQQWMDSEINPLVYELWELDQLILDSLKMTLMNIRNRVILYSNEKKEGHPEAIDPKEFSALLRSFLKKTDDWKLETEKLMGLTNKRLVEVFQLSDIFNIEKPFLPIPLQSTINQYQLNQNPIIVWLKEIWNQFSKALLRFKSNVEQEEALSLSEKIVRYIQNKKAPQNNAYSSIFLTKGYFGKSFWVGRANEISRFKGIVDQWRLGFRGAVILSGQRFSGKSLFGEYVASQLFQQNTVRLLPNSSTTFEGRILNTTYDLQAALDFIKKYGRNTNPLVWIDNIEQWNDPENPLSKNVRTLNKAIDNAGGKMFFMVAMGNWTLAHLKKTHEIQNVFQAEINLDWMPLEEIKEAIIIRHGATHKTLFDQEGNETSPQEFQKIISNIYRSSNGIIGEALMQWSNSIYLKTEDKVGFERKINYSLPEFINPNLAILLSTLMMEKRTNEYRLRKLFGPSFSEKYQSIILRLISTGILHRQIDGWLQLNDLLVNDIGKLLHQKKYLKFYK